jgi:hypothetical protein
MYILFYPVATHKISGLFLSVLGRSRLSLVTVSVHGYNQRRLGVGKPIDRNTGFQM